MGKKLFGTDGIRRKVGESPLNEKDLFKLGKAIALWAFEKYDIFTEIVIAQDTRESSNKLKNTLKKGLATQEIIVYDLGILPTPAIASIIQHQILDIGIIITASHNPYNHNGIKIIDFENGKLDEADEKKITDIFYGKKIKNDSCAKSEEHEDTEEAARYYIEILKYHFEENFLNGVKVVLDCANGATYKVAPEVFRQLGAKVIAIADTPNGKNINKNCGSTHPQNLQKEVIKHNAHIGFAFDGDGDRTITVNKNGQIKDGDDILCILADHTDYKEQSHVVGTIFTNYGLESYLKNKGKKLIRTLVGDKFVAKTLKEKNLLLGGEQSGHIIMQDYLCSSDGTFTALKLLETIQTTKNWELKTFEKFPLVMINIPVKQKKNLKLQPFASIISKHKAKIKNGAIVVRYSGTENLLRVMVQEENNKAANDICLHLSEKLKVELFRN